MTRASSKGTLLRMSGRDRQWWQRSDQFHWFSAYLQDRDLALQWRLATFTFTVLFASVPVLMMGSPLGPSTNATRTLAVLVSVLAVAAGSVWLLGWPSRGRSLAYHAICSGSIALGCLTLSGPYGGLMGCAMFAAIGGMLAYFHALTHVLANFVVAATCVAVTAWRLHADTGDTALVVASVLVVLGLNLGVPFGIHALVHSLHSDLRLADHDPLTGLPNRRSFFNAVHELFLSRVGMPIPFNVTMIDVDDFKKLNDTRGHAAGDAALVGIGAVLQRFCAPGALVGRIGGEEFVVADIGPKEQHVAAAESIRRGISALPGQLTASLGCCTATLAAGAAFPAFLDEMIAIADAAMYRSKRAGGDRVQYVELADDGDALSTSP
ncbi:diguanylate cyclase (GGDEF) domain-containing protein [Mycolicibacterium neoaurum]|nr:diguanylate cyclase (GGDEF) domain-containing protein [Mycolicibacterium neoaurum]